MKFFVWVSRERWGFIVLPILREGDLLYKERKPSLISRTIHGN